MGWNFIPISISQGFNIKPLMIGNPVSLFEAPARITKREIDYWHYDPQSSYPAEERFSFSISYKNNLDYDVWLYPYFAFGTWVDEAFTPYSPQGSLINYTPTWEDDSGYAMDGDWMRLGGAGWFRAARNMSLNFPEDKLSMSTPYLKVPAGSTRETGFNDILIGEYARSRKVPQDEFYRFLPSIPPIIALFITRLGTTDIYKMKQAVQPPLDLDIAIKTKVYRCEYYTTGYGHLVDTGIEVWGGLLGCAHITNAWGSFSEYYAGHINVYEWKWVDIEGNPTSPPDWTSSTEVEKLSLAYL